MAQTAVVEKAILFFPKLAQPATMGLLNARS
jgi:hypothetical protein